MEFEWRENRVSEREKVLEELVRGRRIANDLKIRLDEKPFQNFDSVSSEDDLSERILESFTKALSLLNGVSHPTTVIHHRVLPYPLDSGTPKSDDSGCSSRKRRITAKNNDVRREESSELIGDVHMWRKYGQKNIRKYKHPRSYYRCTYWEEGCEARKHVQQTSDSPSVYRTTYFGRHTCENPYKECWSGLGGYPGAVGVVDDGLSSNIIRFDKVEHKEIGNKEVKDDRSPGEGYDPVEELSLSDFPMVDQSDFVASQFDLGGLDFDFADPCFWNLESEIQQNEPFLGADE